MDVEHLRWIMSGVLEAFLVGMAAQTRSRAAIRRGKLLIPVAAVCSVTL